MRTIVSIISEQTIPNYLFVKEMYQTGDKLMFISSEKMKDRIKWIEDVLGAEYPHDSKQVILENEENWSSMTAQIESALIKDDEYLVNLTGGTKYMALAIQSVFMNHNSSFYYIPYPQNIILSNDDKKSIPIKYRVTVDEYTRLYNQLLRKPHNTYATEEDNYKFFEWFTKNITSDDNDIIAKLRNYRDEKKVIISDLENKEDEEGKKKKPRVDGLFAFLTKISFKNNGILTKTQIQYLTGGWFEEYVYYRIKNELNPKDIILGPKTQSTNNDLDVVFTLGNKLYVIECKTGVEGLGMLHEIVYKASALKENLLGLSARSFIFALGKDEEMWDKAARNMGITYYGRTYIVDEEKFMKITKEIRESSMD